ncbi:hypothetical protein ZOSMA_9G00990 [Zostera marina]|uniref:Uncharacterized protein n=1 Tax=Zostera marina TaxID=29655 RepID=A0A0K9NGV9_ZOSMR|nr:hypothetical protein ZOSMA_9G00990 [Zostera marina]
MASALPTAHDNLSEIRCKRKKTSFRGRCLTVAKQQKTRFYILGRCVAMLLCWHVHHPSD